MFWWHWAFFSYMWVIKLFQQRGVCIFGFVVIVRRQEQAVRIYIRMYDRILEKLNLQKKKKKGDLAPWLSGSPVTAL